MALYYYPEVLKQKNHSAFGETQIAGTSARYSGIYRCVECGFEDTVIRGRPLPPMNSHPHSASQPGEIRWKLAVTHEGEL